MVCVLWATQSDKKNARNFLYERHLIVKLFFLDFSPLHNATSSVYVYLVHPNSRETGE